jgi:Protein of unknown function (DUF1203)
MTTATGTTFAVRAIEPDVLTQLRVQDDAGQAPRLTTDPAGGTPLRCCLRRSRPGALIALVSYAPLRRWARAAGADPGPYDEVGPIFIHRAPCVGPYGGEYPVAFLHQRRVLRAYSADGRILGGRLAEASELGDQGAAAALISEIFADQRVAVVHARAVEFGCFTFEIRRASCAYAG